MLSKSLLDAMKKEDMVKEVGTRTGEICSKYKSRLGLSHCCVVSICVLGLASSRRLGLRPQKPGDRCVCVGTCCTCETCEGVQCEGVCMCMLSTPNPLLTHSAIQSYVYE